MNNEIIKIAGKKYLETDEGTYEITGENIERTLELENYCEYLKDKIDFLKKRLPEGINSDKLMEIFKMKFKKDIIFRAHSFIFSLATVLGILFLFSLTFTKLLIAITLIIIVGVIPIWSLVINPIIDIKELYKSIKLREELYESKLKELEKIKNYEKKECPEIERTEIETFSHCPYSPTIALEDNKSMTLKRSRGSKRS